jgi:amino acid adenylation domain-containing protein
MIRRQALATPSAVASSSPSGYVTFGELEARAKALGAEIRTRTEGASEPVVSVALDGSEDFLVAVLACWKAGAAYLPIDTNMPEARIRFMLDGSAAAAIITSSASAAEFASWPQELLLVDATHPSAPADLATDARAAGLAYVIYTSGSTGVPKAVGVEHRSLVSYVRGVTARLALPPGTRWAAVSSFATDLAHTALFPPLVTGGSVHVVPRDVAMDPFAFDKCVESLRIDCLKITPSHLGALLGGSASPLPRLRLVLGGEPLHRALVQRVRALAPQCVVYNHYGPTEATVGACTYRCDPEDGSCDGAVPIGRPLPGAEAYVLDANLREVARGARGELYIGGAGVARGYLGQPEATAERFLPSPFADSVSERMYRTGDLVEVRDDGNLVFLGRGDDQVKIRGYRVEPAEIEITLVRHPRVSQAVVTTQHRNGRAVLVAHLVPEAERAPQAEMEAFVARALPDYMVPREFVWHERFSLLASGKVDRAALADERPRTAADDGMAARGPRPSNVDDAVLDVYREVLGDPALDATCDFFASGGDSLLAVRIAALLRDATGGDVPVAYVFMYPTPAELADALGAPTLVAHGSQ